MRRRPAATASAAASAAASDALARRRCEMSDRNRRRQRGRAVSCVGFACSSLLLASSCSTFAVAAAPDPAFVVVGASGRSSRMAGGHHPPSPMTSSSSRSSSSSSATRLFMAKRKSGSKALGGGGGGAPQGNEDIFAAFHSRLDGGQGFSGRYDEPKREKKPKKTSRGLGLEPYKWSEGPARASSEHRRMTAERTMDTALCVVPPDEAWDAIQRARHLARDNTYHLWPPAIRLFHPFCPRSQLPGAAESVSELIDGEASKGDAKGEEWKALTGEEREGGGGGAPIVGEAFEVVLDRLVILPHLEGVEEQSSAARTGGSVSASTNGVAALGAGTEMTDSMRAEEEADREETLRLIESEERKGRQKLERRRAKKQKEHKAMSRVEAEDGDTSWVNGADLTAGGSAGLSPRQVVDRQNSQRATFNGPCVVCLEPSPESRANLEHLRENLRSDLLAPYDAFSPGSALGSYDALPRSVERKFESTDALGDGSVDVPGGTGTFRPLLTLGKFSTVKRAVEFSKSLQESWEPLAFNVEELHFVSRTESPGEPADREAAGQRALPDQRRQSPTAAGASSAAQAADKAGAAGGGSVLSVRSLAGTEGESELALLGHEKGKYGCDAMVLLLGDDDEDGCPEDGLCVEEDSAFEGDEQRLLDLLLEEKGEAGGAVTKLEYEDLVRLTDRETKERRAKQAGSSTFHPVGPAPVEALGGGGGRGARNRKHRKQEDEFEEDESRWEGWLEEGDDDWDEGFTLVLGRTQFFTGEMRQYVGMPASSTMDGKDRILGEGVSAVARRKGAVHRQGDRWIDGDFGQKEKDYRP